MLVCNPAKDECREPDIYASVSYHPSSSKLCKYSKNIYTGD